MSPTAIGLIMLVGSYGAASDTTFHTYDFDCQTGSATLCQALTGLENPSFLAVADGDETVLAVYENQSTSSGLTMMKRRADSLTDYEPVAYTPVGGGAPCHVVVSPDGKYAVTSNYAGGSITIVPFDGANATFGTPTTIQFDGRGLDNERQATPHAHFTSFTPDGKLMITDDLGTDRLHVFPLDANGLPDAGKMTDIEIAAGSGPRHLVYDRSGENAYLINEIGGTVTHLRYDSDSGTLTPLSYILADYEHGAGSGDIHLSPDGRFLYASNRLKGDGLAIFAVDQTDGSLTPAGFNSTGIHPRNFAITPDGNWLAVGCRDDNTIEIYRRNPADGSLTPAHTIPCPKPVCILFLYQSKHRI